MQEQQFQLSLNLFLSTIPFWLSLLPPLNCLMSQFTSNFLNYNKTFNIFPETTHLTLIEEKLYTNSIFVKVHKFSQRAGIQQLKNEQNIFQKNISVQELPSFFHTGQYFKKKPARNDCQFHAHHIPSFFHAQVININKDILNLSN